MATHDYDIANQSGAAFRTDLNNALAAIQSNNSNSSSPATTVAYQWWADTTSGTLKIRNAANNAWIELFQLDGTLTLEDGSASTPALAFRDDLNTGIFSSAADTFNVATAGTERLRIDSSGYVGIGNTSMGSYHSKNLVINSHDNGGITLVSAANEASGITFADGTGTPDKYTGFIQYDHNNNAITFGTNGGSERLRIDSSGRVMIGTTTEGHADADTLTIAGSGAAGLTFRTGTTSTAAIYFSDSTSGASEYDGFFSYSQNSRSMFFGTATTTRMVIDSSGNIGIGTSNPNGESINGSQNLVIMDTSSDGGMNIKTGTSGNAQIHFSDTAANGQGRLIYAHANDSMQIYTAGSERMRIDGDGQVGVGTSTLSDRFTIGDGDLKFFHSTAGSAHRTTFIEFGNSSNRITSESNFGSEGSSGYTAGYKFTTKNFDGSAFEDIMALGIQARGHILFGQSSADTAATGARISAISQNPAASYMYRGDAGIVMIFGGGGGSGQVLLDFRHGGTGIGSVSKNGTSNVSYNTSSDYRLKENIVDLTGAITRIKTLQPKRFNWISDETNTLQDGFLAHEVTAVPEAITGTKDAVVTQAMLDSGQVEEVSVGDPIYQQIDQSKLVPLLVAAVQELITKVETLEAA